MPRRPAPTALRLFVGPTPPRHTPRHTMPLPPPPTFYPTEAPAAALNATPATEQQSAASSLGEKTADEEEEAGVKEEEEEIMEFKIVQEAPVPPGIAQDPTRSLHALSKAQNPHSTGPLPMQTHNTNAMIIVPEYHERQQPKKRNNGIGLGPWDRTKNLAFTDEEVEAMVPPPKPVAVLEDLGMR